MLSLLRRRLMPQSNFLNRRPWSKRSMRLIHDGIRRQAI
jgi:hypothetical protein